MVSDGSQLQIPSVDFRGVSPSSPGGGRWDAARDQAMSALESFGCFEVIYHAVSEGIEDQFFRSVLPELFQLPTEIKSKNELVGMPYHGYIGQIPMAYDSLRIEDSASLHCIQQFTSLMWPDGNPTFSNAVWTVAKQVQELELMVVRMILQSMDAGKHYDSLVESLTHGVRLSEYGIPFDQETKIGLNAHVDPNMLTIVYQYQVDGLEVQTRRDGEWIRVVPQPNSFIVMLGESFRAWSNGRLHAPLHRVRVTGNQTRYSLIFSCRPKDEILFQAPKELVDEEHPVRFRPYRYPEYIRFRFSAEGAAKHEDTLQAYVGVEGQLDA